MTANSMSSDAKAIRSLLSRDAEVERQASLTEGE